MRISFLASLGLLAALASPAYAQAPAKPATPAAVTPAAPATALIDINSAPKAELIAKLKGVGDVRADAIIKGRPYKGKDELFQKDILPKGIYDDIKDLIVARQK